METPSTVPGTRWLLRKSRVPLFWGGAGGCWQFSDGSFPPFCRYFEPGEGEERHPGIAIQNKVKNTSFVPGGVPGTAGTPAGGGDFAVATGDGAEGPT